MNKEKKLIDIVFAGSNCVLGTILKEHGTLAIGNLNHYNWFIMADWNAFGLVEDECKSLKLENYIIFDRKTCIIKGNKTL